MITQKKRFIRLFSNSFAWLIGVLILTSCANSQTAMQHDKNSLVGKIYIPAENRFIDAAQLNDIVRSTSVMLIGETHDNVEHHQKQVDLIKLYLAKGQTGLAALEMVTDTQMENVLRQQPQDAPSLIKVLGKEGEGWEYKKYYENVFQSLYDHGFMITAANLNRSSIAAIMMQGAAEVPKAIKDIVAQVKLNDDDSASLQKEIEESHCGMLMGKHAQGMIMGQRVRDAYMAKAVVDAKTKADKVLLLAGSGHVRKDRGVPIYMKFLAPELQYVSIGLAEVVDGHEDPHDYAKRWGAKSLPFDYVWFTEAADRPDPCEELRKHMKKMPHNAAHQIKASSDTQHSP